MIRDEEDKHRGQWRRSAADGARVDRLAVEERQEIRIGNERVYVHEEATIIQYQRNSQGKEQVHQQVYQLTNSIRIDKRQEIDPVESRTVMDQRDPLFYGVNGPRAPEPEIPQRHPAPIPHERGQFRREFSELRVFQRIPWWVMLLIFLGCIFTFGLLITWMFRRRKSLNNIGLVKVQTPVINPVVTPVVAPIPAITTGKQSTIIEKSTTNPQILPTQTKITEKITTRITPIPQPIKVIEKKIIPTQSGIVQQKVIKQLSPPPVVPVPVLVKKEEIQKKIGIICEKGSFTFNDKCYFCPNNQKWNGSNCVIQPLRHLKRAL